MVADALSRIPYINNISTISSVNLEDLLSLYQGDSYFSPILETLQNPEAASPKQLVKAKNFEL